MSAKVEVNGDVGVAVNAEDGATVHVHMTASQQESQSEEIRMRAVHILLKSCDAADYRTAMERISNALFGSKVFKSLSLEQLIKLQVIADEITHITNAKQMSAETEKPPTYNAGNTFFTYFSRFALWRYFF
ncbi:MAG: hypothetical protein ACXWAT_12860 [Methylobacter sp.]